VRLAFVLWWLAAAAPAAAIELSIDAPSSLAFAAARVERVDLPRLEQSLARAGLRVPERIEVVLIAEDDRRAESVPQWIAGFAVGDRHVVIFPARVLSYPYESLESVVRHEIAHAALTATAGGLPLPRWFHEGVAVVIDSGWDLPERLQLLLAMRSHRRLSEVSRLFGSGTQPDSALAYRLSAALVDDLRRRHGAGVPGAVASRVAEGVPFDQAFSLITSETPDAAAERAWTTYQRATVWIAALTSPSMAWVAIVALAFAAFAATLRRRARRRQLWEDEEFPPIQPR
jgi:hypothetical protein